jgi:hypothetical protein
MHLSESAASFLNDVANWVVIICSVIVILAGVVVYWTGKVKEGYSANAIQDAKADAVEADKKAAIAREKAEHLERGLASRNITEKQIQIIKENIMAGAQVSIFEITDKEAELYGDEIEKALSAAGAIASVGKGNVVIPPPVGILVRFNHEDPKSKSVFLALEKAGINPIDDGNPTDDFIVRVKVGIKDLQF